MIAEPFLSSAWYRVARRSPKLRDHASVQRHRYRGSTWYVVQDHATGRVHRLSPAGYMVVAAMDGMKTVDRIWQEVGVDLGEEAPSQNDVIHLLAELNAAELLQTEAVPEAAGLEKRAAHSRRSRWLASVLYPMALRIPLWQPDRFFERTSTVARWLFGLPGVLLWLLVVLPAMLLAAQHWEELGVDASDRVLAADNIVTLGVVYLLVKAMHEFGHGFAVKAFGGAVHELGVMILVLMPLPYVDASAASAFRSKWRRALVGAAGMIVEVFLAGIALFVWLTVEPGMVRAVAFDVMTVAGISTVLFNGNPLLRYDGYYILTDLLEIPNLAQRSVRFWGHLVDRYIFRTEGSKDFVATEGERIWFLLYAPAAFVYRQAVMLAIAMFIASEYPTVGVALAAWSLLTGVILPLAKALWLVLAGPRFQHNRTRAVSFTFGSLVVVAAALCLVPLPVHTTTEGVVWLPENAIVRAGTDGFVRALLAEPGSTVRPGDALVESEEPTLVAERHILQARVDEARDAPCHRALRRPRTSRDYHSGIGPRASRAGDRHPSRRPPRHTQREGWRLHGRHAARSAGAFPARGPAGRSCTSRGLADRAGDDQPGRHRPRPQQAAQHKDQASRAA
jgi:putative peptide zinc metalloprotease protein